MNNTILLLKMKYCFPIIKQVRKIYELGLRFLTKIKVSFKDDPSFLLVNCRTKNQEIAYKMLKNRELHGLNSTHTNGSIKLTIIILFRDKINLTIACLNSLVIQDLAGIELQIILIDNGSVNLKIGDQLSGLFFGNNNIAWKLKRVDEAFNF